MYSWINAGNKWETHYAEKEPTLIHSSEQLTVKVMSVASQIFREHAETGCSATPRVTVSSGEHVFDVPNIVQSA